MNTRKMPTPEEIAITKETFSSETQEEAKKRLLTWFMDEYLKLNDLSRNEIRVWKPVAESVKSFNFPQLEVLVGRINGKRLFRNGKMFVSYATFEQIAERLALYDERITKEVVAGIANGVRETLRGTLDEKVLARIERSVTYRRKALESFLRAHR